MPRRRRTQETLGNWARNYLAYLSVTEPVYEPMATWMMDDFRPDGFPPAGTTNQSPAELFHSSPIKPTPQKRYSDAEEIRLHAAQDAHERAFQASCFEFRVVRPLVLTGGP